MRITMTTMMRQYTSRLSKNLNELNKASRRVETGRAFERASENPSAAVKATQLNRQYAKNADYLSNLNDTKGLYEMAEGAMMDISKAAEDAYVAIMNAVNEPVGAEGRKIYAQELRGIQQQIVLTANGRFSDQYLFGGSSTKELPFALSASGELTFRGINVNTTDPDELAELDRMANEHIYVDLGFGIKFDAAAADPNTIVRGSAFDTAFPGIKFLGFGQDSATGEPKNIVNMLGRLADELESPNYNYANVAPLMTAFDSMRKGILVGITELGTSTIFMDFTKSRLEDAQFNLEKRINDTEYVDTAWAIVAYEGQKFSYETALKMGSGVITPSFIDFMR